MKWVRMMESEGQKASRTAGHRVRPAGPWRLAIGMRGLGVPDADAQKIQGETAAGEASNCSPQRSELRVNADGRDEQ